MDRNKANLLLDYYGGLLTDHQREILENYYFDDLSMNEIGQIYNISKAAVSDLINRSLAELNNYEDKVGYIKQNDKIISLIEKNKDSNNPEIKEFINKLNKIIRS